jgi:hypothetical protein
MESGDQSKYGAGLRNVIVFGRAVTNALQNLRSVQRGFDEWYTPWQLRLREDPVAARFYQMRSEILKEGKTDTRSRVTLNGTLDPAVLERHKPHGAVGMFISDTQGRSGWEVRQPDGSIERMYISIPNGLGFSAEADVYVRDMPEPFTGKPIQELGRHYVGLLADMVSDAKRRFLP